VRQLENVLLNAWVMSDRPELLPDDFDLPVSGRRTSGEAAPQSPPRSSRSLPPSSRPTSSKKSPSSKRYVEESGKRRDGEKERILSALRSCNWNRVKAAHMLGLPRRTFYRRLKEYGIQ
jgi:DNA-binding NtrC family response regulator